MKFLLIIAFVSIVMAGPRYPHFDLELFEDNTARKLAIHEYIEETSYNPDPAMWA